MKREDIAAQGETNLGTNAVKSSGGVSMQTTVSVAGLGKRGACMAAAMASRGVHTIGVDANPHPVDKVRQRLAPVFEPGLAEMIASCLLS